MKILRILAPIIIILAGFLIWRFSGSSASPKQNSQISSTVDQGEFTVFVTAEGELQAKRSKKIMGPSGMRMAQIWETTIQDLIAEGTVVKEGDYVAQLDRTEIQSKMNDIQVEIDKINTQLEQARIDTSIEMRGLRDQLINLQFGMEENKLQVELSKYEPQAVIRQKNIEYEKSEREYSQQIAKIDLTQEKNKAKIQEIQASLRQEQNKMNKLLDVSKDFTVTAPADGMVIYARTWEGKVTPGSRLRAWDPTVAELPDLSEMISKTYINEVDISKVKPGMAAKIYVDAFPDKSYTGMVQTVANIGEQLRNTDAKVFEVVVSVDQSDSILRPAMTTRIEILTEQFEMANYIPLEALFYDSLPFVYMEKNNKLIRQEVLPVASNDFSSLIALGLDEGERVFLSKPDDDDNYPFEYLNHQTKEDKLEEYQSLRDENLKKLAEQQKMLKDDIELSQESSGGRIIMF